MVYDSPTERYICFVYRNHLDGPRTEWPRLGQADVARPVSMLRSMPYPTTSLLEISRIRAILRDRGGAAVSHVIKAEL